MAPLKYSANTSMRKACSQVPCLIAPPGCCSSALFFSSAFSSLAEAGGCRALRPSVSMVAGVRGQSKEERLGCRYAGRRRGKATSECVCHSPAGSVLTVWPSGYCGLSDGSKRGAGQAADGSNHAVLGKQRSLEKLCLVVRMQQAASHMSLSELIAARSWSCEMAWRDRQPRP
ncbi:hypothetical protein K491DRAFT_484459 [Lophiostoma macrostomum CBS 122681]|uniref:Uncharacterized protein n=1 Tax=Lophiostoma macrostomum CBS 122681 TaxID=1314788 RepID=A0A6A6T2W2_9PLEO|nr:hypothetical protein K491DRAFT_484459 [Lophiostoma macrostomum CBS 122681]